MSTPAALSCALAVLVLGLPVLSAGAHLEARHRAAGAADAAALAAADAVNGFLVAEPCEVAAEVAAAVGTSIYACDVDALRGEARVTVRIGTVLGGVLARARAAPEAGPAIVLAGVPGANGWAWPSGARAVTQGHHDGTAIDLAVGDDGLLYAPYDGTVVRVGGDGGGVPAACRSNPEWWRGTNHTVVIAHDVAGRKVYSSHNHIAPGSPESLGVRAGSPVLAGQAVAAAGMSGCTSGIHSHFTLSSTPSNASADIDPYEYLGPP
ncbi:Rv3654c family TadE-like protein [Leucobacter sp. gxy201]|uniref:Rv3654c family TadE-like protein n=1 Tax=Leucobacter sp. gxy201 TaxID=2957200 RepID=UPI003DA0A838